MTSRRLAGASAVTTPADGPSPPLPGRTVAHLLTGAQPDGRDAVGGAGADLAGATRRMPAKRLAMGMYGGSGGLRRRVAEHVVEEAQETLEAFWSKREHMFVRLGTGSDGTGVLQRILQACGRTSRYPGFEALGLAQSDDHTSSFVRTRLTTASVNSVVPEWPPRSGVRVPEATASSAAS